MTILKFMFSVSILWFLFVAAATPPARIAEEKTPLWLEEFAVRITPSFFRKKTKGTSHRGSFKHNKTLDEHQLGDLG